MGEIESYRSRRLREARAAEDEARAVWERSRKDIFDFTEYSGAVRNRERAMYEAHDCYGEPYKCISCGCSKGRPCVSHRGSQVYANELMARIAEGLER